MSNDQPKIFFMDTIGKMEFGSEFASEFDERNREAEENCEFKVGDRVKLTSACPKDTLKSCQVRVGDIGTLLGVTAWPVNDGVIVQADVRWDHADPEDPIYLGIFVDHLEKA